MGDSSSFSSLFALVDNHLSKTNLQQDGQQPSTSGVGAFRMPTLSFQRGASDTRILVPPSGFTCETRIIPPAPGFTSTLRFPIPSTSMSQNPINTQLCPQFSRLMSASEPDEDDEDSADEPTNKPAKSMSDCPINDVLAIQLSNMFKAREEEEKKRLELLKMEENLKQLKLEESQGLIDLMPAVQRIGAIQPKTESLSSASSMESVCLPETAEVESESNLEVCRAVSPLKPIRRDMRYILKQKLKSGKCSQFGKVLCARYKSDNAPYVRRRYTIPPELKVFDFSTPSPDDILIDRLRRPSFYTQANRALTVYE